MMPPLTISQRELKQELAKAIEVMIGGAIGISPGSPRSIWRKR